MDGRDSLGAAFADKRQYRVFVAGENLTNEEYSTMPGYPDYGIRFYAGLRLTL